MRSDSGRSIARLMLACCVGLVASGCMRNTVPGDWQRGYHLLDGLELAEGSEETPVRSDSCSDEACGVYSAANDEAVEYVRCGHCVRLGGGCRTEQLAEPEVGYHNHPRFFPVPTRPIFLPRVDCESPGPNETAPPREPSGAMPSNDAPPRIEVPPLGPIPEGIPAPQAEPAKDEPNREDRVAQVPARLPTRGRFSSWIFFPPQMREPREVTVRPRTTPQSVSRPSSQVRGDRYTAAVHRAMTTRAVRGIR